LEKFILDMDINLPEDVKTNLRMLSDKLSLHIKENPRFGLHWVGKVNDALKKCVEKSHETHNQASGDQATPSV
jgi:hypothetical protein